MRTDTQLSFQIRRMVPLEVRAVSTFLFLQLSCSILHCICCFHSVFLLYILFTLFAFVHVSAFLHLYFLLVTTFPRMLSISLFFFNSHFLFFSVNFCLSSLSLSLFLSLLSFSHETSFSFLMQVYTGQVAGRQQRLLLKKEESSRKFSMNAYPGAVTPTGEEKIK